MSGTQTGELRVFPQPLVRESTSLVFGRAPRPLECGLGLQIGAGVVHPEINFTLPPMAVNGSTWGRVVEIYDELLDQLLTRARQLELPGLVVEFEHLPPMTRQAEWGAELTRRIKGHLRRAHDDWGLASALRVTIVDLRDDTRPPRRRDGDAVRRMFESLDACAAAGADLLSIESTGGKEVHDKALLRGDVEGIALALGVLAPRDMAWLWDGFVAAARRHGCVAAGDSACGFANTAMQLAGRGMLPDVLAALVRAMSAARSLVAFERGAVGPSKDCAYEGPVLKAITGFPISMEGRSATCAHLSPIGNIAGAAADLWSNESVPDVRLLSGPAPVASLESLAYDCRLFNAATARGQALVLRDLHVASDCGLSPQAFLLTPEASLMLAAVITGEHDPYRRTVAAARAAIKWLGGAGESLRMSAREGDWLDRLSRGADALPDSESDLLARTHARYGKLFDSLTYGLSP